MWARNLPGRLPSGGYGRQTGCDCGSTVGRIGDGLERHADHGSCGWSAMILPANPNHEIQLTGKDRRHPPSEG